MYTPKLDIIEVIMHFRFVSNILQIRFALVSSTQWDENGNKSAIKYLYMWLHDYFKRLKSRFFEKISSLRRPPHSFERMIQQNK